MVVRVEELGGHVVGARAWNGLFLFILNFGVRVVEIDWDDLLGHGRLKGAGNLADDAIRQIEAIEWIVSSRGRI